MINADKQDHISKGRLTAQKRLDTDLSIVSWEERDFQYIMAQPLKGRPDKITELSMPLTAQQRKSLLTFNLKNAYEIARINKCHRT